MIPVVAIAELLTAIVFSLFAVDSAAGGHIVECFAVAAIAASFVFDAADELLGGEA